MMERYCLCLLLLVAAFATGSTAEQENDRMRVARIFAFTSTTTKTTHTTTTLTAISTCLSTATAACTGRRKRALIKDIELISDNENESNLESSVDQPIDIDEESNRVGKQFKVWKTSYTTLTLTTTSYIAGTTVTISAVCNTAGGTTIAATCFG